MTYWLSTKLMMQIEKQQGSPEQLATRALGTPVSMKMKYEDTMQSNQ